MVNELNYFLKTAKYLILFINNVKENKKIGT